MQAAANPKIVFVGTGAVGSTVGAWVSQIHENTYLLSRGHAAKVIAEYGITLYQGDEPTQRQNMKVKVIHDLGEVSDADVVVIAVKLYDLEGVAQMVKEKVDDRALVLGLQNGVANQTILPKYFSRVIYGVISHNAWVDQPGVIGYQVKRPVVIGTPDNSLQEEMQALAKTFQPGIETLLTQHLQDAVHCKVAINLSNSVTTLIDVKGLEGRRIDLFQDILANTVYEGVQVIRASGYHEEQQGGLPSWRTIWALTKLPHWLTRRAFKRNLKQMNLSSMGQDVLLRHRKETELEDLNGYLLRLAHQVGVKVPYNEIIYRLCKERFFQEEFRPVQVEEVWEEINNNR